MRGPRWFANLWLAASALGLVGCVTYKPAPVDLSSQAQSIEGRRLTDPGLKAYAETCEGKAVAEWPPARWDFPHLTQAALYFHPAVAVAVAEVEHAKADLYAAGLHQDPTFSFSAQYQSNTTGGLSPWTAGPVLDVPLTVAGKRGIRQAQAAARLRESELKLQGVCFQTRSALRAALVAWQFAGARLEAAEGLAQAKHEALAAIEASVKAGESSEPDAQSARAETEAAQLAAASARKARDMAHAALAGSLGIPQAALEGISIGPLSDAIAPLPAEQDAEREALTGRSDVLASLAAYVASDQGLRLAIAEQYPDLHLQPGYLWDQGAVRWQLGLSLILPLVNRNRGAIAQAEAERVTAGQRVLAAQVAALREVEEARAACTASAAALESARAQALARKAAFEAADAALKAGEVDRLALALARVGLETANLDELSAEQDLKESWGRMEDAIERPLSPAKPLPPPPGISASPEKEIP